MTAYKSDFLAEISERGFIHQCTDIEELDKLLSNKCLTAYIGFDASADSLHVGSLVPIMLLRWLQKTGHKPIVLMGGGTTMIGDPSGKDTARQALSKEQINQNIQGILPIFKRYLTFGDGTTDATLLNNIDWLESLQYLEFLRNFGRHFTINRMLSFDSVKLRLDREEPLTFLEFNYMIIQAYDFFELYRKHDCLLQLGGSDQWGNIVNGIELVRRLEQVPVYGLTAPLITTASGEKMGKTAQGAVWLNADRLSPYDFWQFWRNTQDADVGRFLRLFTELPIAEIKKLEALEDTEVNEAKKILADEVTRIAHGEAATQEARTTAQKLFEAQTGGDLSALPIIDVQPEELQKGIPALDLLYRSGLVSSKGEARRLIRGKGARLNDNVIQDEALIITPKDLSTDGVIKLSAGKKKHALVRVI